MARKFLYIIAGIIVLIITVLTALRLFGMELSRVAFVPSTPYRALPALSAKAYDSPNMWIARPDMPKNPALWRPEGLGAEKKLAADVAVFFLHPTSYLSKANWNAPLDDAEANQNAARYVRNQASVFNATPNIWAPRYRQATFGTFLTDQSDREKALSLAYEDIAQSFDAFLAAQRPGTPIILAGHSQGALHLSHLLKDRVAGRPLARRIIAAYAVGWPISIRADLPALGLPGCSGPAQTGCVLSWQSFAEPADYQDMAAAFDAQPSLTDKSRGDAYLCTNPLTGGGSAMAPASANKGTLRTELTEESAALIAGAAPARCDEKGYVRIGEGPDLGPLVLPGNNYHVYDYSLFWANIRADVARRTAAFLAKQ
jgi:hypothetical protein